MITEKLILNSIGPILRQYREMRYFPSACVRVFNDKETLAAACIGDADNDSVFDVASLTKIATATQVLFLIDEGRLALRAPLEDLFEEIREDEYLRGRLKGVTLYHLLTHTSTIVDWYPFYSRRGEKFFDVFRYALEHTAPTEGMVYSDLNFMLLGLLLERLQKKPLVKCLREDLADRLGIPRMVYHPPLSWPLIPSDYGNRIEMGMCRERGIPFDGFRPLGVPVIGTVNDGNSHYYFNDEAGHAGIFADALSYEILCRFYMNSSSELFREAQREQKDAPSRGLGLETGLTYPHGCGHTGFTGTCIYFSGEYRIGTVIFTNRLFWPDGDVKILTDFRRAVNNTVFALRESGQIK